MRDETDLMGGMSVSHLMFSVRARDTIILKGQPGAALRGALYGILADNFCTAPGGPHTEGHAENCPVCWLLALEDPDNPRGRNLPRPLTIQPPAPGVYEVGEAFHFGVTLIGLAQNLFPYVARAVARVGNVGVGQRRGRFRLETIYEVNPLLDASRRLLDIATIRQPKLQVNSARIKEQIPLQVRSITLDLYTPTRLTSQKRLVKTPDPAVFMARLIERCQQLVTHYSGKDHTPAANTWRDIYQHLTDLASSWTIAYDETQWVEVFSGSRRRQRSTPISGLVGRLRWEGDLLPAYSWLLWGQSLHVGKDAVKGNGWYRIIA